MLGQRSVLTGVVLVIGWLPPKPLGATSSTTAVLGHIVDGRDLAIVHPRVVPLVSGWALVSIPNAAAREEP